MVIPSMSNPCRGAGRGSHTRHRATRPALSNCSQNRIGETLMKPETWVEVNLDLLVDEKVQQLVAVNAGSLHLFLRLIRDEIKGEPFASYDPVDEDALMCLVQVGMIKRIAGCRDEINPDFARKYLAKIGTHNKLGEKIRQLGAKPKDDNLTWGESITISVESAKAGGGNPNALGIVRRELPCDNQITKRRSYKRLDNTNNITITNKAKSKKARRVKETDEEKEKFNADVQELIDLFAYETKSKLGFSPTIGTASVMGLRRALKKYGKEKAEKIIRFYVASDKAERLGCTLSHAFTEHTINMMEQEVNGNGRRQSGVSRVRATDGIRRGDRRTAEPSRVEVEADQEVDRINRELERRRRERANRQNAERTISVSLSTATTGGTLIIHDET